jgi:hypothetical protein
MVFSVEKTMKTTIIRHPCEPEVRFAVCEVKTGFQPVLGVYMREAQQTASGIAALRI